MENIVTTYRNPEATFNANVVHLSLYRKCKKKKQESMMGGSSSKVQINEKSLQCWLDNEVEVMENIHEVQHEYEKQSANHGRMILIKEMEDLVGLLRQSESRRRKCQK